MRIRRGLDRNGRVVGMGRPWMDCLARSLEGEEADGAARGRKSASAEGSNERMGHVLRCLISVAEFAEKEHGNGGGGAGGTGGGGGCASSLLQSLSQLGFLLVDCAVKDGPRCSSALSDGARMRATPVLVPGLDVSSFHGGGGMRGEGSDAHAAASIGRSLLCCLFYQSAAASSHFLSSSLITSSNYIDGGGGTALCRSILRTSFDKLVGTRLSSYRFDEVRSIIDNHLKGSRQT